MCPFYPLPSATQWIEKCDGLEKSVRSGKLYGGVEAKNNHGLTLNSRDTCWAGSPRAGVCSSTLNENSDGDLFQTILRSDHSKTFQFRDVVWPLGAWIPMNKIHSGALKNYLLSQNIEEKTTTIPPLRHSGGEFSLHTEAELILGEEVKQ